MGILFELRKTTQAEIYLYAVHEQSNFLLDIKGNFNRDYNQLLRLIDRLALFGEIRDETKFKHISKKLFELKTNKIRVFCLLMPGAFPKTFILNHYYKKQGQKTPGKELNKARKLADDIIEQYQSGRFNIGV